MEKLFNINELNQKWQELAKNSFMCYELVELVEKIAYDLFKKDAFNDALCGVWRKKDHTKVYIQIKNNIYFTCCIYSNTGIFGDCANTLEDAKIEKIKELPKKFVDVWQLIDESAQEE